jgi:hypothetical protein
MKQTFLDNMGQQPTLLLMATAQKKKIKKNATAKKILCHRTKHTFIFFANAQAKRRKKMKECFLQRFENKYIFNIKL